jgi:hypothetical protein
MQFISLTMIVLPFIFEINFVEVMAIFTYPQIFLIWRGVPGAVLICHNAIASFSLWWQK